ncbi:hypothetical protein IJK16_00765 [Candidatus Saccharibacteria bacterium]|nr:hypothetical protein [Candidatus Saccharibacteria bacterium]
MFFCSGFELSNIVRAFEANANGREILLAPGQTIIEAVPTYGAIEYK